MSACLRRIVLVRDKRYLAVKALETTNDGSFYCKVKYFHSD